MYRRLSQLNCTKSQKKFAVDPVRGVREFSEMSQMKAETKKIIYKLVLVAKIYVLSLQKMIKTWENKSATPE